jgi:hypothetical protein
MERARPSLPTPPLWQEWPATAIPDEDLPAHRAAARYRPHVNRPAAADKAKIPAKKKPVRHLTVGLRENQETLGGTDGRRNARESGTKRLSLAAALVHNDDTLKQKHRRQFYGHLRSSKPQPQ